MVLYLDAGYFVVLRLLASAEKRCAGSGKIRCQHHQCKHVNASLFDYQCVIVENGRRNNNRVRQRGHTRTPGMQTFILPPANRQAPNRSGDYKWQ